MERAGRTSRVYFAHNAEGSAIKVGLSGCPEWRCHKAHWALIGSVPGDLSFEAAMHWALREHAIGREWFRSCAPVWRFALDTVAAGKIAWLPASIYQTPQKAVARTMQEEARARWGSAANCAKELGLSVSIVRGSGHNKPAVAWGRLQAACAAQDGLLPDYLTKAA